MTVLSALASAFLALIVAHGIGRLIFRDWPEGPVRLIFRIAAGLGAWSLALLALGIAGRYTRTGIGVVTAILAIPALLGGRHLVEDLRAWRDVARDRFAAAILAAAGVMLLFNLGRAIIPTSDLDSLRYHLAAPKLWLLEGRLHYLPTVTINGPAAAQCMNGVFLAFPGPAGAAVFSYLTLVLAAALVVAYGSTKFGPRAGAIAGAAFVATLAFKDLIGSASDMPMFTLLALAAMIALAEGAWLPAALFAGFAAGAKMAGLPLILIVAILAGRRSIGLALVAALVAFPWYLKSWIWTGNPVWPFLFGGRDWSPASAEELRWFLQLGQSPTDSRWLASLAYRAILWKTGAAFLLVAPLLVLVRLDRPRKILLAAFALVVPIWWFSSPQPRFLIPYFGAVAIVAGAAAARIGSRFPLLMAVGAALLAFDLAHQGVGRAWRAWRGQSEMVVDFRGATEWINRLPEDSVVLLHGTGMEFHLERRYVIATPFVECAVRWAEIRSPAQLRDRLRELGITHVLTVQGFGRYYPSPPEATLLPFLDRHGTILFQDGRVRIYRVDR